LILTRYERMIARRYLRPGKGEGFIFLVAAFSLGAVAISVMALVVVMSVMNGFRAELFDKIIGLNGQAVVQSYGGRLPDWRVILDEAKRTPGITSAIPMVEQPLMASSQGRVEGVLVRGMRVPDILGNPTINGKIVAGSLTELKPGSDNVGIGRELAEQLGVGVGAQISLIAPEGHATPFGTVPRIVAYRVAAIFDVGVYDYDKTFVIMPIEDAQNLLMMGEDVSMIELRTADPDRVQQILAPLSRAIAGEALVSDWRQMNSSLFQALQVERVTMFSILSLLMIVCAFNIFSSVIMLVRAKTRDIAVLRTMGASRGSLLRIFMTVGVTIGVLGTIVGLILATILLFFRQGMVEGIQHLTGQNLWDPSIRFITELPSKTSPLETAAIVAIAIGASFLFTLYPAWRAANTDPVQVLRYE
jgi:lipoprotein-releasing system permease protein